MVRASAELQVARKEAPVPHKTLTPRGEIEPPAPRASGCPRFVRRRVAARLPEICDALIARALEGDMQAVKLLWQMGELDQSPAKPARSSGKTAVGFARKALAEFHAR